MKAKIIFWLLIGLLPCTSFAQWEVQSTAFQDSLRSLEQISVVDHNVAWAIARDGSGNNAIIQEFTKTNNGGMSWTAGSINGASGLTPTGIFALNEDTAWVLLYNPTTDGGKVFRTNDGGLNWFHQPTALFVDSLEAYPNLIYFWNENDGFCMGDPNNGAFEIYTTSDGGNLWSRVPNSNLPSLISGEWGYSGYLSVVGNSIWFGTSKGNIYHSSNKGVNWTSISNPFLNTGKIRVIQFKDSLNGIIGDRSGTSFSLYRTSNGGNSWQAITPTGNVYGRSISYVPGTPATLISTSNASAMSGSSISYDFGDTWTDIPSSSGMEFSCLSNFTQQTGWAGLKNQSSTVGGVARYKIYSYDAGITNLISPINPCKGSHDISVGLKNHGYGLIDTIDIHWKIDGVVQMPLSYNTLIAAGEEVEVLLGNQQLLSGANHAIEVYSSYPNGQPDTLLTNDTLNDQINVFVSPIVDLGNDTAVTANTYVIDAGSGFSSYLWSTTETTQTIVPLALGWYMYWVEVTDSNGCTDRDTINVHVSVSGIGMEEFAMSSPLTVFPNPSKGQFYIQHPLNVQIEKVMVFDESGRLVYKDEAPKSNFLHLEHLKAGLYIVKVEMNRRVYFAKVLLN